MDPETEFGDLTKGGITVIQFALTRNREGLRVSLKTVPEVEDFFRGLGNGHEEEVAIHGRYWIGTRGETPLTIYNQVVAIPPGHDKPYYRVDRPGQPLLEFGPDGSGLQGAINLSFLRLKGISTGAGVSFTVSGVYSRDLILDMKDKMERATLNFYKQFLKPLNFAVFVSTQEVPTTYTTGDVTRGGV